MSTSSKPHLAWIGHIGSHTGLARVSDNILVRLAEHWRITVIAVSAPSPDYTVPWARVIPAKRFQNWMGSMVLRELLIDDPPDMTVLYADPWVVEEFLKGVPPDVPLIGYLPVDGLNMRAAPCLHRLAHAIFLSPFAVEEARKGGYTGPASVIGHGVDLDLYRPLPKAVCRALLHLPQDARLVGNVGQNQPRKRWDLTFLAFSALLLRWQTLYPPRVPIYLYAHCQPLDVGWHLTQLAEYLGITESVLFPTMARSGCTEAEMPMVYNSLDLQWSTSWGEGFGLTTLEGMACGVPQIVPDHTALHDWAEPGACLLPAAEMVIAPGGQNLIGYVPDVEDLVEMSLFLLDQRVASEEYRTRGLALVTEPQFRWDQCAAQFQAILAAEVRHAARA